MNICCADAAIDAAKFAAAMLDGATPDGVSVVRRELLPCVATVVIASYFGVGGSGGCDMT